jgi:hypothetical protein
MPMKDLSRQRIEEALGTTPSEHLPVTKQADRIAVVSIFRSTIAVLRWVSRMVCNKKNCGTVCKCEPCMAREALEFFDPEWRP